MTAPVLRPVDPWVVRDDLSGAADQADQRLVDLAIGAATEVLWALSGRRFGTCSVTVRPCKERPSVGVFAPWPWMNGWWLTGAGSSAAVPVRIDGVWMDVHCGCAGACRCGATHRIPLPRKPVCAVTEVKVDGAVLDPDAYRVDEFRYLARVDGGTWQLDQDMDLADSEPGTWSVTFTYGLPVPALGKMACQELAREFIKDMGGADCALPKRMTSIQREGLSVALLDPQEYLDKGKIGVYYSDLFIATFNPSGLTRRSRVYRADARGQRFGRSSRSTPADTFGGGF